MCQAQQRVNESVKVESKGAALRHFLVQDVGAEKTGKIQNEWPLDHVALLVPGRHQRFKTQTRDNIPAFSG